MPIFIGDKLVSGGNGNTEKTENKISSFSESDKTSTEKYPSSKAVWDTFLPRSGGTLSWGLGFKEGENRVGDVNANSYDASLTATTDDTYVRYRRLYVSNPNNPYVTTMNNIVGIQDYDANGEDNYYAIFGEHNMKELQLLTSVIDVTSEDGVNYTAVNAPDIPLRDGMTITVRPNMSSNSLPYLDAFGSGLIKVALKGQGYFTFSTSATSSSWTNCFYENHICRLTYASSHNLWFVDGMSLMTSDISNVASARIRNIYAGTTDMTSSSTALTSGRIYLQYE